MKPFIPNKLPLDKIDWQQFIELIGNANYQLARYEGTLKALVNPSVLLSPLTTKEAVLSSKIEGTQATLQEVLTFEASPNSDDPKYNDIKEIINYRKSIFHAVDRLKERPLSLNMIKELHSVLLDSVRGANKDKGNFRKEQNWIGKPGSLINDAYYVPPDPLILMEHLSNLEKYIHYNEKDKIIQLAIIHAQFEIIHPFLDGNGRIGRILIPIFLFEKKLLSSPVFYMSEYFESHRDEYYIKLREITEKGYWNEWIDFFLNAFIKQANTNIQKTEAILSLYEEMKREIHKFNSSFTLPTLDSLFFMPVFNSVDFTNYTGIPKSSAARVIKGLTDKKIITMIKEGKGRTPNSYSFNKLIQIVDVKI